MSKVDHERSSEPNADGGLLSYWRWGVVLGLLAASGWFLPTIAVHTPLGPWLIEQAIPSGGGKIEIKAAQLGWNAPLRGEQVTLRDDQGRVVATIASLHSERTLWELLWEPRRLGKWTLQGVDAEIALREDGSNAEDLLDAWLAGPIDENANPYEVEIALENASLGWARADDPPGKLVEASGDFTLGGDGFSATLQGQLRSGTDSGPLELAVEFRDAVTCRIVAEELPLAAVEPLLRRLDPASRLSGRLTSEGSVAFDPSRPLEDLKLDVAARGERLFVACPLLLGQDAVQLEKLTSQADAEVRDRKIHIANLALDSDVGQLTGKGVLDLTAMPAGDLAATALQSLRTYNWMLKGRVDLARLAELLPGTLRIREGATITSGRVDFQVSSETTGAAVRHVGSLATSNLTATHQGRAVVWDQPLTAEIAAVSTDAGWTIENLRCESDVLTVFGAGDSAEGSLTIASDLDQLRRQAAQFLQLDGVELAGQLRGTLAWRPARQGGARVDANLRAAPLRFAFGDRGWNEQQVDLRAATVVQFAADRTTIEQGEITVTSQRDEARATLLAATHWPRSAEESSDDLVALELSLRGDLGSWLARASALFPLTGVHAAGTGEVTGRLHLGEQAWRFEQAQLDARDFEFRGFTFDIHEPVIAAAARGEYRPSAAEIRLPEATISSTRLAARAADLVVLLPKEERTLQITGSSAFRGQLSLLDPWLPTGQRINGQFEGTAKAQFAGDVIHAAVAGTGSNVQYLSETANLSASPTDYGTPAWQPIWSEAQMQVDFDGGYHPAEDTLDVRDLALAAGAVAARLKGTVAELTTRQSLDLAGQATYDLSKLTRSLQAAIGPGVILDGTKSSRFQLRGPLWEAVPAVAARGGILPAAARTEYRFSPQFTAQAGVGWERANVYQLEVSGGQVDLQLADRQIAATPIKLAVGGGTFAAQPRLDLRASPTLLFDPPLTVDQVALSPALCQHWLRYVAPALADTAAVEGSFSMHLSGGQLPLATPEKSLAAGVLTIHQAKAGPGPVAKELIWIAQGLTSIVRKQPLGALTEASGTWIELADQRVPFQVAEGRVYHRGLAMQIGDVVIRTGGSVGFDQTLDLVAEVPIRREWANNDRLLAAIPDQMLRVPIGGTLQSPKLDKNLFKQFAARAINNAAGRVLDRLIGPPGR